jgi:hypothetical protein
MGRRKVRRNERSGNHRHRRRPAVQHRGTEMFVSDAKPGESPDLGLWAQVLESDEVEELQRIVTERLRSEKAGRKAR